MTKTNSVNGNGISNLNVRHDIDIYYGGRFLASVIPFLDTASQVHLHNRLFSLAHYRDGYYCHGGLLHSVDTFDDVFADYTPTAIATILDRDDSHFNSGKPYFYFDGHYVVSLDASQVATFVADFAANHLYDVCDADMLVRTLVRTFAKYLADGSHFGDYSWINDVYF